MTAPQDDEVTQDRGGAIGCWMWWWSGASTGTRWTGTSTSRCVPAAAQAVGARLVSMETVYLYGPPAGQP